MREGWKRVPLGAITQEQSVRVGDFANEAVVLSSTKHHGLVKSNEYFKNRQIYSSDISGYKLVRKGWFAYATNHLNEGSIGLQDFVDLGCVSPIYTVFSCSPEVDAKFMYRLLKSDKLLRAYRLHDQASVDRRGAVRYRDFKQIEVQLPPLAEQQRIAKILDEVDTQIQLALDEARKAGASRTSAFRRLLVEPLQALAETEVSRVGELIGTKSGLFEFVALGALITAVEAGSSPDLEGKPAGEGQWGFLKVSAVGRDGFRQEENKRVDNASLIDPSIEVRPGDLLVTRANTPDLVGMSCVVETTRPGLMLCDKTLRLTLHKTAGSAQFLSDLLRLPEVRRQIEVAATGTSSSMKNISQESLRGLVLPWGAERVQAEAMRLASEFKTKRIQALKNVEKLHHVKKALMDDLLAGNVCTLPAPA